MMSCNIVCGLALALYPWLYAGPLQAAAGGLVVETIDRVQPKIVKIFGAGGFRGLEAYQSGFLISAEGHVLTSWSYVLDSDVVTVVLNDGRQFSAELLGADPQLEIAVLKLDATDLPHFNLEESAEASAGSRVLAFSNLFGVATGDEPASVQHGTVAARTQLAARRGAYETPFRGSAYVLDAMTNNPGAAGGALCNSSGELLGILGKELRNSQNHTWLNYAIPISELRTAVDGIRAGNYVARSADDDSRKSENAISLEQLGLVMVPDVLDRTPPFIDGVRTDSPAQRAGLQADDLVLFVADRLTSSCKALRRELEYIDNDSPVHMTVMRGQELVNVVLEAFSADATSTP
ncbi:MAG: S1C family serine protease [Pirellulales bacterium]